MRVKMSVLLAALLLSGCGGGAKEYAMSADEARSKLLASNFDKGIVPGSSELTPDIQEASDGSGLEWQVLDDERRSGWWCPIVIEPIEGAEEKVRVTNNCSGIGASSTRHLDELVDATLTGRPPKLG